MATHIFIDKQGLVLSLLGLQEQDLLLASGAVLEHVSLNVQVLPDDEHLDRAGLERTQRLVDAEAVEAGVLGDLVEEARDELLLLDELDVLEAVRGELDRLVEPALVAVRHVNDLEHFRLQTLIEHV